MTRIITISREFGSGGRELGKRLADALGMPCYDHQIIELIAKENGFDEQYVANMSEKSIEAAYPLTIAHTFAMPVLPLMDQSFRVAAAQQRILESLAKQGDCVIVGRCADVILREYRPLRLFVYADTEHKVRRCMERAQAGENLSRKEMERRIREVERSRTQFREMYGGGKWGGRESCDLCINTSGRAIKTLIPGLAEYVRCWFCASEEPQAD